MVFFFFFLATRLSLHSHLLACVLARERCDASNQRGFNLISSIQAQHEERDCARTPPSLAEAIARVKAILAEAEQDEEKRKFYFGYEVSE
jgi:hypothetical protein